MVVFIDSSYLSKSLELYSQMGSFYSVQIIPKYPNAQFLFRPEWQGADNLINAAAVGCDELKL